MEIHSDRQTFVCSSETSSIGAHLHFSLFNHFYIELKDIPRQYTYQRGFIATRCPRTQAAKLARVRHAE